MNLQIVLDEVRKSNPGMTREKLIEELEKSETSARVLIGICGNDKKSA